MKKHLKKGDQAAKRARDSLHKVKNMEKDAIQSKKEAVAQEAYAKNIDIPIALTALKNANIAVETEKNYENEERDEFKRLEQERAAEHARIKSIERHRRKNQQLLKVKLMKAQAYKTRLTKAEATRNAILTANTAKIKAIKKRLDDADENFKAADKKDKAPKPKAPSKELGDTESAHLDASNADAVSQL